MIRLKWTDLVSDSEKESCVVVLEVTLASRNDPLTPFSGLKLCLMYPIMRMSSIKGCLTSETTMVSSNYHSRYLYLALSCDLLEPTLRHLCPINLIRELEQRRRRRKRERHLNM